MSVSLPAGMSLMTQVGGVLKAIAKDFNVAALVRTSARLCPSGAPASTF